MVENKSKSNEVAGKEKQSVFKWLFTRWYLYVITFIFFISGKIRTGGLSSLGEEIRVVPLGVLGELLGTLIFASLFITVIYLVIKLIKKLIKLLKRK